MTTMDLEPIACGACGQGSLFMRIGSTNCFGPSDLDLRPAEMQRSTMPYWVQRCPHCGYCVPDVAVKPSEAVRKLVGTKRYKETLADGRFPELANAFHCNALISSLKRKSDAAFWSYLHAAWACDDNTNIEGSKAFRMKAIDMLMKAREKNVQIFDVLHAQETMLVELYRRAGRYEDAERLANSTLKDELDEMLRTVLNYERWLIAKQDDGAHNVQEAIDHAGRGKDQ